MALIVLGTLASCLLMMFIILSVLEIYSFVKNQVAEAMTRFTSPFTERYSRD